MLDRHWRGSFMSLLNWKKGLYLIIAQGDNSPHSCAGILSVCMVGLLISYGLACTWRTDLCIWRLFLVPVQCPPSRVQFASEAKPLRQTRQELPSIHISLRLQVVALLISDFGSVWHLHGARRTRVIRLGLLLSRRAGEAHFRGRTLTSSSQI